MSENRRQQVTIKCEHVLIVEMQQITHRWCVWCGSEVEQQTQGDTPSTFAEIPRKTYRDGLPPSTSMSFLDGCKKRLLRLLLSAGNRNPSRQKEI